MEPGEDITWLTDLHDLVDSTSNDYGNMKDTNSDGREIQTLEGLSLLFFSSVRRGRALDFSGLAYDFLLCRLDSFSCLLLRFAERKTHYDIS